ncbi:hypothetical protein [Paenibacillus xylaniclasticus]|uniref:hypothetical protein n=1 Tax=Paenibacillus xylaniclasticus TaxID=588083 RepID=UPI000FD87D49|nr:MULTISPECIES: hypothetical protein [Paenibacillus]GFN29956.1 hypothetical protein PCURB6_02160 [Paenibacillus curdlanolyticus]
MANRIVLNILIMSVVLLISSCGANDNRSNLSPDERLPAGYTIANIESAMDECINYFLWSNPDEVYPRPAGSEPYVGQQISVEVRVYTDKSDGQRVFALSNLAIWKDSLFTFDRLGGAVYCTGHSIPNDESWPEGDYEVIDTLSLKVQPVRNPHFGTSPEKDRMMETIENELTRTCIDFTTGTERELWLDSDIYVVDFFEYEKSAGVWFIRQDGYAYNSGIYLELDTTTNEYVAIGLKGYALDNIHSIMEGDPARFIFDRQMQAVIKHYKCTESGLKHPRK